MSTSRLAQIGAWPIWPIMSYDAIKCLKCQAHLDQYWKAWWGCWMSGILYYCPFITALLLLALYLTSTQCTSLSSHLNYLHRHLQSCTTHFLFFLTLRSTRLLCASPGSQDFSTEENDRPFTALKSETHQMHLTNKSHIGNYCDPITHAHMWLRLDPLLSTARPVTPAV